MTGSQRLFAFLLLLLTASIVNTEAQTTVVKTATGWSLLVDGKPFDVKGVTFGYADDVENFEQHFKELQYLGVNTIRLWATNEHTAALLDAAQAHGIKVMVGIWMRHGRPGMEDDDRFNYLEDTEGMEEMFHNALQTVKTYKHHPAVLSWGIGNEVYLNTASDAEKEAYSILLERICRHTKAVDPSHPITSVEAWTFGLDWWEKYVPSLDIYGLNCYGPGAALLADELKKKGIDKPYLITEFGVTGEWDIEQAQHGIKVEPTDRQKYSAIAEGYPSWIAQERSCLGAFIFHYASGNNFTAAWLFTHFEGRTRPQYWGVRKAFTKLEPMNHVPEIESFEIPGTDIPGGTWVPVALNVSDAEGEAFDLSFYYNQRTGSRKRRDQLSPLPHRGDLKTGLEIRMPEEDGAIKIYVTASDTYGNLGMASTAVAVADERARQRAYLVPKVSLPFYVYWDYGSLPYTASGYMGNYEAMEVDLGHREDAASENTCIKIGYTAREDWYGLAFVDPANDWGDILGGYDITGAETFRFRARTDQEQLKATIGFGLIGQDKPFPDTDQRSLEVVLTPQWKQYNIKLKKSDLGCIRSGLVIFSNGNGFPHEIYLDNVVFE